jgi:hypothetical protein
LLERGYEGVLCELLRRPDVADDASQPGDEPGRLDPPDRFDRAMRFVGQAPRPPSHPVHLEDLTDLIGPAVEG